MANDVELRIGLVSAWERYWAADHLGLAEQLHELAPTLLTTVSGEQGEGRPEHHTMLCELWLMLAHLAFVRTDNREGRALLGNAVTAARASGSPVLQLATVVHSLDHLISAGQLEAATDLLLRAQGTEETLTAAEEEMNAEPARDLLALRGRLRAVEALLRAAGHSDDATVAARRRDAVIAAISRADELAVQLGGEHRVAGIAFGLQHLRSDCVFAFLCLKEPENALKIADTVDTARLEPLRHAQLLADMGIAYGDLGDYEAGERCEAEALALIPGLWKSPA